MYGFSFNSDTCLHLPPPANRQKVSHIHHANQIPLIRSVAHTQITSSHSDPVGLLVVDPLTPATNTTHCEISYQMAGAMHDEDVLTVGSGLEVRCDVRWCDETHLQPFARWPGFLHHNVFSVLICWFSRSLCCFCLNPSMLSLKCVLFKCCPKYDWDDILY